jgi:hypothetical protein
MAVIETKYVRQEGESPRAVNIGRQTEFGGRSHAAAIVLTPWNFGKEQLFFLQLLPKQHILSVGLPRRNGALGTA